MEIALGKGMQVGQITRIGGDPDVRALAVPASEALGESPVTPVPARVFDVGHQNELACS
jgi:hypothetical protein